MFLDDQKVVFFSSGHLKGKAGLLHQQHCEGYNHALSKGLCTELEEMFIRLVYAL